jgi:ribosomal protein S18 acetylase RimI-like enzyme
MEETVDFMSDDPFSRLGLQPVQLADQQTFRPYFASLTQPLSDYTFSQIYTWRNSLHIIWKILAGHLCVFANGSGDLTLLLPPIGDGQGDAALREAFELMDDYNSSQGVPERSRVEYASEELLTHFDRSKLNLTPMGTDYIYDVKRMIDLAGGDLSSKRQAKNRFLRLYEHRTETYDPSKHLTGCLALLEGWRTHQDAQHLEECNTNAIKRQKETIATELALRSAADLDLKGMVVYVKDQDSDWSLRGFTFGEYLGENQSSIIIEKTDLQVKGLAQFIFSEFCRQHWADRPLTNVGDDWGLESLAWTKMSYRPVQLLAKYAVKKTARVNTLVGGAGLQPLQTAPQLSDPPIIRPATRNDVLATLALENSCFSSDVRLKKRQLRYLQQRSSAVFLVAEEQGNVIGEGIALVRQQRRSRSGRIYSLAVDPRYRGRQTGRRLLLAMIEQLAARGVKRVYLEVEQGNIEAIALYQRNGFRSIGVLPDYYAPGRDAMHMMRDVMQTPTLFDNASLVSCDW